MNYTSSEAAKLLRKLNEDLEAAYAKERASKTFLASIGEDVESVRPEYDFKAARENIAEIQKKIRIVKHALNIFNTTTVLPEFDITIDEALVLIPQLSREKSTLSDMKNTIPKTRATVAGYGRTSAVIDYRYANYSIDEASEEYAKVCEKLDKLQTALDLINSTCEIEIAA